MDMLQRQHNLATHKKQKLILHNLFTHTHATEFKQPLVCDCSETPEPLLVLIIALLEIQRKFAHARVKNSDNRKA